MEVSFSGYGAKRSVRIHAADPGAVPGASTLPLPAKRQRNGGGEIASTRTIKGALGTRWSPAVIGLKQNVQTITHVWPLRLLNRSPSDFVACLTADNKRVVVRAA